MGTIGKNKKSKAAKGNGSQMTARQKQIRGNTIAAERKQKGEIKAQQRRTGGSTSDATKIVDKKRKVQGRGATQKFVY